jgi:hypothetical protein
MLYSSQQTTHLANPSWDVGSMMITFCITFPKVSKFINMMMMMQPCKILLMDTPQIRKMYKGIRKTKGKFIGHQVSLN